MKRYAALLRGVNICGRNRVPMTELKKGVEALGFTDVRTHLNSGNVVFSGREAETAELSGRIGQMMQRRFGLDIPVFVLPQEELADILRHAPDWWGTEDKEIYDNLIFILPPAAFADVYRQIGEPKAGLEKIHNYKTAVFWSFRRKDYQKTNWWPKTAAAPVGGRLTIRTANTVRRIAEM
mgnify:FL=1